MKKLLLAAFAAIVTLCAQAQLTNGTVYWIQDAATGQFISQGANWGTQATVQEVGGLGFEAVYVSDGVYKLKNIMWNKVNNADLGLRTSDRFCDQAAENVTLIASDGGYKINTTNGGYLCNNGDTNGDGVKRLGSTNNEAQATIWKFLTKSEYEDAIQAYKDGNAATYATNLGYTASTVAELEAILTTDYMAKDYTTSITNPSLGSNWDGWTHAAAAGSNRSEGAGIGSGCAEFWNGCGTAKQTVSNLPNGLYKVEFVGTFRPKDKDNALKCASEYTSSPAFVYANDAKIELLHWIDVPAQANGRSAVTKANGYGQSFYTYVTDGTLALGIVQGCWENSYMWCPFGQFTLTYYSDQVADADITAIVATIPTVPGAVASTLTDLKNTLESSKTIAAYNALSNAITAANVFVAPYAAYKRAAEDAAIAGVAAATINEQNAAVEEATTVDGINACTTALRTAIAAATSFDITTFTITNPSPYANGDGWTATNGTRLSEWASNPVTYDSGNKCAEMWSNQGASMLYTITNLPAGSYRLTAIAGARNNSGGVLKVGDKTAELVNVGSVNSRADAKTWFDNGGGVNELFFTLDNIAAELTIGVVAGSLDDAWTLWRSFKLETFTETAAASYLKPGYDEAMAAAVAYQTVDMFDADKTALNTAISENTIEEATATIAAYETAVVNLNAAVVAAATAAEKYTRYHDIVAAIGGNTNVDLTSFVTNGDFQLNNLNGWTSVDGGNVANNGNFNSTYFVERWKNGVALGSGSLTHDAILLPAGLYRINADAQNIEQYNNAAGGTGLFLCANEEKTEIGAKGNYAVYVKVADKTPLTIKFLQDNCTGNWIAYDNVTLTYVAADYVYSTVDGKMNADVAAAQTAAVEAFEAAQNGANYQAMMEAIAAAQASKDAYTSAATAIESANNVKNANNVVTSAALTAYETAISTISDAYDNNTLTTEAANNAGRTLGSTITGWHAAKNSAASEYLSSTWDVNDITTDDYWASYYINTWSIEGETDGSNFKAPFFEYHTGSGNLGAKTMTASLSGLTPNKYHKVTVDVRVQKFAEGDAITLQLSSGNAIDVTTGDQIGSSALYLGTFIANGKADGEGNMTIAFNVPANSGISWLCWRNMKYEEVDVDYAALNTAIANATTLNTTIVNGVKSLEDAIAVANALLSSNDQDAIDAGVTALNDAVTEARATITARLTLAGIAKKATALKSFIDDDINDEISAATAYAVNKEATSIEATSKIDALNAHFAGWTEVTLTNATFDTGWNGELISPGTAAKPYVHAVEGWTQNFKFSNTASQGIAAAYGSAAQNGTNGVAAPATDMYGSNEGGALHLSSGWDDQARYYQNVDMPAGKYVFYYEGFNANNTTNALVSNYFGVSNLTAGDLEGSNSSFKYADDKNFTYNEWKACAFDFTLNKDVNNVRVGVGVIGGSAGSGSTPKMWFDNVKIYKYANYEATISEDANFALVQSTDVDVTLNRTIKADTWNSFVVPFDITNAELKAAFGDEVAVAEFSENSADENDVQVAFNSMTTPAITANKPVLLKGNAGTSFEFSGKLIKEGEAKVAGTNVDFVGAYAASTDVAAGNYFISGNKLWKSAGNTTLKGTRAYIDAKNVANVRMFIDDMETSISEIDNDSMRNGEIIYNMAGQRVSKAQKGLYIVNGRKVIVK